MSDLLWIPVPGGREAGQNLLRVLIVPRLDGGTLEESGMAEWPPQALLDGELALTWRAADDADELAGPAPEVARVADGRELWRELFDPGTPVGVERRRTTAPELLVARTATDAKRIGDTFAAPAGVKLGATPSVTPQAFDDAVQLGLAAWTGPAETPPPASPRGAPRGDPGFNQTLGALREHPAVLRALGLVLELVVAKPEQLANSDNGQVKVSWPEAPAHLPPIVSPWTRYGRRFLPGSTAMHSAGMVTLTPDVEPPGDQGGGWEVVTVDVDTGARRLRDAAAASATTSLPAMRTAGIQVVRPERGRDLAHRRDTGARNAARASLDGHVLDADDLVLGYRMDVRRSGGDWRTLHGRKAKYTIRDLPAGPEGLPEEGHVKANGARRIDDERVAADEVVVRWSGWSLALARPRFAPAGAEPAPKIDRAFKFEFELDPGTPLPQLRFTDDYDVRLRVADIAGGGLAPGDLEADRCALRAQKYRRHEPVPSPAVLLEEGVELENLGVGEAVRVVVIRDGAAAPAGPVRRIARPSASLSMAEQHRELDNGLDHETTFGLLLRDDLPDPAAGGVQAFPVPAPGSPGAQALDTAWPGWPEPGAKSVELAPHSADQPPLRWEGTRLFVRLKPAETLDVELSSKLTADFRDHFHIAGDLPDKPTRDAADAGRHPLITPAETVAFIHAVRIPLRKPDAGPAGLSALAREPGQTSLVLRPGSAFGVDGNSTVRLDVMLAWEDRTDEGRTPGAAVASFPVERGQREAGTDAQFEFADTRHRTVTPTLKAVGRFRQFYDPNEPDSEFCLESDPLPAVNVLSTARPAPPVVLGVRPAFRWIDEPEGTIGPGIVRRTREGGRLRVELARPWYLTGEGERLAVVLWDHTGDAPSGELLEHVTQAGRDPIWDTGDVDRWPAPSLFFGTPEIPGKPRLADRPEQVVAVPHEPFLDGDRWWADVRLPGLAAASYAPFVRLAVARYQPNSLEGLELSRVVIAPMAPLLPDRALTVVRAGDTVRVTLDGLGPAGPPPQPSRVDVVLESCDAPGGADLAALEPPAGGVPAWQAVPGAGAHGRLGDELALALPAVSGLLRVRVREVELVGAEAGAQAPLTSTTGELAERSAFFDVIAVPAAP
jgi:hypothetical protein